MKKPKISVIIPLYNREKLIYHCLKSIYETNYKNFEVIVVDDGSRDNSVEVAKKFSCKIIKNERNIGVSYTRNMGAKHAKGNILYFVDSDVIQKEDNITKIVEKFERDPELDVVAASLSKNSFNKGFGSSFIALKYFYLTTYNIIKKNLIRQNVTFLPTCSVAIKKDVFDEVGGFKESFKLGGEEYELGHRISKKHIIYIYRDILVIHNEPTILKSSMILLKRGIIYSSLFSKWKKFESIGKMTLKEAFVTLLVFLTVFVFLVSLIFPNIFIVFLSFLTLFLILNLKFYYFILKQKNLIFMIKGLFADFILYFFKGIGVSIGFLKLFGGFK